MSLLETLRRGAARWTARGFDLLCPPRCGLCGADVAAAGDAALVCAACEPALVADRPRCLGCGAGGDPAGCGRCGPRTRPCDGLAVLGPYADELREAILRAKRPAGAAVAATLAALLVHRHRETCRAWAVDVVVPVPMHWRRRVVRGTSAADELARGVAAGLGLPCRRWLVRHRGTRMQNELPPEERRGNVAGAFRASRAVAGRRLLLVDDVATTGSTLAACRNAAVSAGAAAVYAAVVARAERAEPGGEVCPPALRSSSSPASMTAHRALRIGTRGSSLAVTQTGHVVDRLRALGVAVELETITTRGDLAAPRPVGGLPGDGVFVRELEQALLDGRIDAAVHSLKDLPTAETAGLDLACVPLRAAPFDALVGRPGATLAALPAGAVVGTSSVRRIVQVRRLRPDLVVRPVRGNVDTRLKHLDAGHYDGLILAAAGLERLGLAGRITESLEPDAFWPAVGQGALVVQIRTADDRTRGLIAPLDDPATHAAVRAERACLAVLAGGCLAPIGGWARCDATGRLVLGACVLAETTGGVRRVTAEAAEVSGPPADAAALGRRVAEQLLRQGAADMLASMRSAGGTPSG